MQPPHVSGNSQKRLRTSRATKGFAQQLSKEG
jgi:hypothetical protein